MKAYSADLRERVLADGDAGMKMREVAAKYRVSESWVRRLKQRRRETGESTPRPHPGSTSRWKPYAQRIAQLVEACADATLAELQRKLDVSLSLSTLCRAVQALRLTLKQKEVHAAEQDRPDVAQKRVEWKRTPTGAESGPARVPR